MASFRQQRIWMAPRGVFHWLNAVCILCLLQLGFIMMFREELGFSSIESKIALKYVHTYIGFVFLANLLSRAALGVANRPRVHRQGSPSNLITYLRSFFKYERPPIISVRSSSRLLTLMMFALLTVSATTGLFRASTDLYLPPAGPLVARWLATSPEVIEKLDPHSQEFIDPGRLGKLNRVKVPLGLIHKWSAWALVLLIVLHIRMASDLSTKSRNNST